MRNIYRWLAVVLLFAGWFIDVRSDQPGRLYLGFVLTATNYMVLLLALFLSAFSLPADIKNKTIYTVATKPVRPTEMVLGRVLGFVLVGSALMTMKSGNAAWPAKPSAPSRHLVRNSRRMTTRRVRSSIDSSGVCFGLIPANAAKD